MSAENQSRFPDVRITYHADGSAAVNGVPVPTEPGQSARDTAYQVAVALVVAAGASEPVAARSVEADGTEYPITLYPLKAVATSASASVASTAAALKATHGGRAASATPPNADDINGSIATDTGIAGGFESQYRRARRAWYRPRLSMSWLVAGACASVLLSVLATLLMQQNNPSVVRLSVDTENAVSQSARAHALGKAMASIRAAVPNSTKKAAPTANPADKQKHPQPPAASSHAQSTTHASTANSDADADATGDLYQPPNTVPFPTPAPGPKPAPGTGAGAKPAAPTVTNLAVALVGGDRSDEIMAYVITVSTKNANPVTLTYTYAGAKGRAAVKRSVVLSGQTDYALANLIAAEPYCGGPVTMKVSTSPAAHTGPVTAIAPSGC